MCYNMTLLYVVFSFVPQCRKLGLLAPEEQLPDACRLTFQQMWANNGDIISQQYAGTPALKVNSHTLPSS